MLWNNVKVFTLVAGLTALFGAIGLAVGGQGGMLVALGLAAVMNLVMYWGSSSMVLRMYGARTVTAAEAPGLYGMVDRLRQRAGLPMPTVAIAPHDQPNAFATGRNPEHAVVCFTDGILRTLDRDEIEGVIAHELAHIKNRDMLLQTVTATIAGAISNLANLAFFSSLFGGSEEEEGGAGGGLLLMIVAPLAATVVQLAISRQREFKADAVGAEICGRPLALASALRKLELGAIHQPMHVSPAAAPLAQVSPFGPGGGGRLMKLFSTHPPTGERIERLERLAEGDAGDAGEQRAAERLVRVAG